MSISTTEAREFQGLLEQRIRELLKDRKFRNIPGTGPKYEHSLDEYELSSFFINENITVYFRHRESSLIQVILMSEEELDDL